MAREGPFPLCVPLVETLEPRLMLAGGADLIVSAIDDSKVPSTLVPGNSSTMTVDVTNQGDTDVKASGVKIRAYLSLDDQVSPLTDILLNEVSVSINIAATAKSTFSMKPAVPVGAAKGQYYVLVEVDSTNVVPESNNGNNVAIIKDGSGAYRVRTVAWKFGTVDGVANVKLVMPGSLADNKNVTFSISGKGTGEIVSDLPTAAYDLTVTQATVSSKVSVSASAKSDAVFGDVRIFQCSLGTFDAPKADLLGGLVADKALRALSLNNVGNSLGADIDITVGTASDSSTLAAAFASVNNTHLTSTIGIKSLTAVEWLDSVADRTLTPDEVDVLSAPTIGTLKITGKSGGAAGNFQADVVTTGSAKTTLTKVTIAGDVTDRQWDIAGILNTLTVGGTVEDSTISSDGGMKKITLGAALHSDFLAGIVTPAIRHATDKADFSSSAVVIDKFSVVGLHGQTGRFFVDSNLSARRVNTVSVTNMDTDNTGTPFGIFVLDVPTSPAIKTLSSTDTESWLSWTWKPKADRNFVMEDLVVTAIPAV